MNSVFIVCACPKSWDQARRPCLEPAMPLISLTPFPNIRTTKQKAKQGDRRLGAQPPHCDYLQYNFRPFTESDPQPAAFVSSPIKLRRRLTKDPFVLSEVPKSKRAQEPWKRKQQGLFSKTCPASR